MSYPSGAAYGDALQFPKSAILDPLLSAGTVQSDMLGMPFGRSGQFAFTYKVTAGGTDYALRCFQSERTGMHDRYAAISAARLAAGLPYFVDFTYLDPGIRVDGADYPAIRMEWADGITLGAYLEANRDSPGRLKALQQQLHGMALALESAGIAHGDIQSGNILVGASGEFKLVDYDGMFVPQLTGQRSLETGHANFQHPDRAGAAPFDASLDRFSFALLHATMAALIERPGLWDDLKGEPEAPLLRRADYEDPASSRAFAALCALPASGEAFRRLLAVCRAHYADIPTFSDFLAGRSIPTALRPGISTRGSTSVSPESANTPWYSSRPASSSSASGLLDATDLSACIAAIGTEAVIIGPITAVERGETAGLPFTHLVLGGNPASSPRALIWAKGVQSLATSGQYPNPAWNGAWASVRGKVERFAASPTAQRVAITIEGAAQFELLTPVEGRRRLTQVPSGTATATQSNESRLQDLTGAAKRSTAPTAAAPPLTPTVPTQVTGTSARPRSNYLVPIIGIGAIALALLITLIFAVYSGTNDGSSIDTQPVTAGSAPSRAIVEGDCLDVAFNEAPCDTNAIWEVVRTVLEPVGCPAETTSTSDQYSEGYLCVMPREDPLASAEKQIGTCWMDDPEDPQSSFLPVACSDADTSYRVASVMGPGDACDGVTINWTATERLCTEEWPLPTYTVVAKPDFGYRDKTTGLHADELSWTYSSCWQSAAGVVLEQLVGGSWKTVKTDIAANDGCMKGYPWTVEFTRKASGPGKKQYRLYFPATGGYTSTIENIDVTVKREN